MWRFLLRFVELLLAIFVIGVSFGIALAALGALTGGRWQERFNIVWFAASVIAYAGIRIRNGHHLHGQGCAHVQGCNA